MCPSGKCVADFEECVDKNYSCRTNGQIRCGDGFCRESCGGIPTNGCQMNKPVYCQNGSCVESISNCYDYRCSVHSPVLCSNNRCAKSFSDCPKNSLSAMVKRKEIPIRADLDSGMTENLTFTAFFDSRNVKLQLKTMRNALFPPEYAAEYHSYVDNGIKATNVSLLVRPVPMSDLRATNLRYLDLDIDAEFLTNRIFRRKLSALKPYQFLRSFTFQIRLLDYHFNQHVFHKPVEALISFNHIAGYPDFKNKGIEVDEQEKKREEFMNEYDKKIAEMYPIDQPELVYCLGMLNPVTNLWKCVNRRLLEISPDSIRYDIPGPGIFAVIYSPKMYGFYNISCGFFCRNKRGVLIILCFYFPFALIWTMFFIYSGKMFYLELTGQNRKGKSRVNYREKFKGLLRIMFKKYKQNKKIHQESKNKEKFNIRKMFKRDRARAISARIIQTLNLKTKVFAKKKLEQEQKQEPVIGTIKNKKTLKEVKNKIVPKRGYGASEENKAIKPQPKSQIQQRFDTFNHAIRNKDDFDQIKMMITSGEGDLKEKVFTFQNPLVFRKSKTAGGNTALIKKEETKMELKMQHQHLLFQKFKQLQRMKYLREQIEEYTNMVKDLRVYQGIDDLQREEEHSRNKDLNRRFQRAEKKKKFKRLSFTNSEYDRRNLHNFVLSKTGSGVGTSSVKPPYSRSFSFLDTEEDN